jgi:toxin ParE1/3/4
MAKAKVVWRERALEDIGRLYDFLFGKNEEVAKKAAQIILRGSSLFKDSPKLGRPMADGTERRELFIPFGSGFYVLRYFIISDTVVIVRVWHSREDRREGRLTKPA